MTVFVIAMEDEAMCVVRHLASVTEERLYGRRVLTGTRHGRRVRVVVSGIGKSNAAAATQLALQLGGADVTVFNLGLCGGFGSSVELGGVYEVDRAVEYDFDLAELNGTAKGVLNERATPYLPLATLGRRPARTLATGDRFSDDDSDHAYLTQELGATLRDMEGAAVAHVCETAGVVCRALKCVSDVAGGGAMTRQYLHNRARCLDLLAAAAEAYV
jgi:adenosylhomocysteine nucleosidase